MKEREFELGPYSQRIWKLWLILTPKPVRVSSKKVEVFSIFVKIIFRHCWILSYRFVSFRWSQPEKFLNCDNYSGVAVKLVTWRRSGVFIANFGHILHLVLVFLLGCLPTKINGYDSETSSSIISITAKTNIFFSSNTKEQGQPLQSSHPDASRQRNQLQVSVNC